MTKRQKHWHGPITLCEDLTENLKKMTKDILHILQSPLFHLSLSSDSCCADKRSSSIWVLWGRFWDFAMTLGLKNVGHFVRNFPGTSFTFCLYWYVAFILSFTRALSDDYLIIDTTLSLLHAFKRDMSQLNACRGKSQGHLEEWSKVRIANALNKLNYT